MKRVLILLACWIVVDAAQAQNYIAIKLLEDQLKTTEKPSAKAGIYIQLLKEYEIYDTEKSIENGLAAWSEATKDSAKSVMATAAYRLGSIYHFDQNDAARAGDWYIKGLNLAEQIKDSLQIADCSYNLGLLVAENGDTSRAFSYFQTAREVAAARNDFTMVAMAEIAYGNRLKVPDKKLEHFLSALNVASYLQNDTVTLAQIWSTLGNFYEEIKDKQQSKYWFEKVFNLLDRHIMQSTDQYLLELYATSCLRTGRYDESIQIAGKIVSMGSRPGASEWYSVEGLKLMAEGYFHNGYDSLAFWTMMQYAAKKDSLHEIKSNSRAQRHLQMLQAEFDAKKQAQEFSLLQTKNRYNRFLGYLLITCLLLCIIFTAYLYRKRKMEFNQNKQLARLNQTKDKLLSIISHDVRSPIQALQNIINLFEQDIATKEDVYTVTKQVSATVQAMAQGLDNLFYWAQNQQQELKAYPEPFNLTDLVGSLVELFSERFKKKELIVHVHMDGPRYITADILHVRLIVSNVLVNAIKFSPMKGNIHIRFAVDPDGNSLLSVSDEGKGIPEADIVKIFDPSVRYTRPGTAGEPGSGLGLSLTKDLLQLDKNEIVIHSYPGKGTEIVLIFRPK